MSAAVSVYIYDHTSSGQSRLYKHWKSRCVHGTVSYVVFQNILGTMYYYFCTLWTGFYPPRLMPVNV